MYLFTVFKKSFSRFFFWLVIMLLAIAPFVWISISHPHYLQNLNQIISQNKLFFICLRWLLILTIFCTWPRFIRYRAKQHYWKPEKTMFWLNQRLKITLWLVIFELVVCENLFLTLIHTLEGH